MKALSLLLAAALTVSSVAVNDTTADAAKKPKLSKSKVTITVGKTYKIKLKNGTKKAKVAWKTSKKSVVKIVKKSTKGKTAYAQVKGLKKGKATITATYKLGKAKKNLKCTVTVKKAVPAVATSAPAAATSAPAQATATNALAVPTATPVASEAPQETPAPQKTAKPTKTPKPSPTVKPSAEPNPDLNPDVIDIMALTYLELAEGIQATYNDDGSVTLDFTGTSYKGARWYFGTAEGEGDDRVVNQKALNLENYSYVVVEGDNQAGLTADENGKMHDLSTQFLDALDVADHGGLLEIDTQANFAFPVKFELTDKAKRTNVAAYEIYSLGDDTSTKAGPITVKSIKAYKDKATYDKLMADANVTPTPSPAPTATPVPNPVTYNVDLSAAGVCIGENGGSGSYNADTKTIDAALGQYTGVCFKLPETETETYNRIEIDYTLTSELNAYVYDGAFSGSFGQGAAGEHEVAKLAAAADSKTAVYDAKAGYTDDSLKAIKLFNFGDSATLKISAIRFVNTKKSADVAEPTPTPTTAPTAVPSATPTTAPTAVPSATPTTAPTEAPTNTPVPEAYTLSLDGTYKLGETGEVVVNSDGSVTGTGVEAILIPMTKAYAVGSKIKVIVEGEASGVVRSWVSNEAGNDPYTNQVNPIAFGEAYDLEFTNGEKGVLQIKKEAWNSPNLASITVTKVTIVEDGADIPEPGATPTPVPTAEPISIEAVDTTIQKDGAYIVSLDPANADVTGLASGKLTYADGVLSVNTSGVYGDLFEVAVPEGIYKSVEIDFSDYVHTAGVSPDYYGICYKHIVSGGDKNVTTLPQDSNKLVVNFDETDYGKVDKLVFFSVGTNSSIKINSIVFKGVVDVDADKYTIPDAASRVYLKASASDFDIDEEFDVVDYADLGDYVATYKDAFDSFTKMADKTAGSIIKPVGDKDVVYTPVEANKGTISYDGRTTDVEFVKAEGSITAKFERKGHTFEATAVEGEEGIISIKKDGAEGYVAKVSGDSQAFAVELTSPSGKVLNMVYDGTSMSIITTADIELAYGVDAE